MLSQSNPQPSRQDIGYRNLSDFDPINDHDPHMTWRQNFQRLVTVSSRIGVHLDLAVDQVDDPLERDARPAVDLRLFAIFVKAGVGDLDHQRNVARRAGYRREYRSNPPQVPKVAVDEHGATKLSMRDPGAGEKRHCRNSSHQDGE